MFTHFVIITLLFVGLAEGRSRVKVPASSANCQRQVTVYYDASSDISSEDFQKLTRFIRTELFANFKPFEQLRLGAYGSGIDRSSHLGKFKKLVDVQKFMDEIPQDTANGDMRFLFSFLADKPEPTNLPRSVVLFVGKLDDTEFQQVEQFAEQIKKSAYLTIVGIKDSVNLSLLKKLAHNAFTFDVGKFPSDVARRVAPAFC